MHKTHSQQSRLNSNVVSSNDSCQVLKNNEKIALYDNLAIQTTGSAIGLLQDEQLICGKKICDGNYYNVNKVAIIPEQTSYKYVYNQDNKLVFEGYLNEYDQFDGYGIHYLYDTSGIRFKEYEGNWKNGVKDGNGRLYRQDNLFINVRFENGKRVENIQTESTNKIFKEFSGNHNYSYVELYQDKENSNPLKVYSGFVDQYNNYYYGITYYQTDENNPQYEGYFRDGKYTYKGTFYSNSILSFTGHFVDGVPKHGRICYDSAIIYEGDVNEKYQMHGNGIMYTFKSVKVEDLQKGIKKYEGHFSNNKCNGFGKLYSISGDLIYCGYFQNNLFKGKGIYFKQTGNNIRMVGLNQLYDVQQVLEWIKTCNKESFDQIPFVQDCWEDSGLKDGTVLFVDGKKMVLHYENSDMLLIEQYNDYSFVRKIQKSASGVDIGIMIVEYVGPIKRIHKNGYDITMESQGSQYVTFYTEQDEKYFEGTCKQYIPNGNGIYYETYRDGRRRKIEGNWLDGYLRQGEKVVMSIDELKGGSWKFEGEFSYTISFNDRNEKSISGYGNLYEIKDNHTILRYKGFMVDGKFHGKGKQYTGDLCQQNGSIWLGQLVYEGIFINNKVTQYLIRDTQKTKGQYNSYVKKPINESVEVAYYENEDTNMREYDHYIYIQGQEEKGWFIEENHVRFGKKVDSKWEGDVYSFDCDNLGMETILEHPEQCPYQVKPPGTLKWKRTYKKGKYVGIGEYYDNDSKYSINNNMGKIIDKNNNCYEGGLKEIMENNDYRCIREGEGKMTIDSVTYTGTWHNNELEGDVLKTISSNEYQWLSISNGNRILKRHILDDMLCEFHPNNTIQCYKGKVLIYHGSFCDSKAIILESQKENPLYPIPYIPHGQGRMYSDGVIYEGSFKYGTRNGIGKEIHKYYEIYGTFNDSICNGQICCNKEIVFDGTIDKGIPVNGSFCKRINNLPCFTKRDIIDLRHLESVTFYQENKQVVYEGSVTIDKDTWTIQLNGIGDLHRDGKVYNGQWKNDKLCGKYTISSGKNDVKTCSCEDGIEKVHSHIIDNIEYHFKDKSVSIKNNNNPKFSYEGGFIETRPTKQLRNLFDSYHYIPHGKGHYCDENMEYEGFFKQGRYNGDGKLSRFDINIKGTFNDNQCHGEVKRGNEVVFEGIIQDLKPVKGVFYLNYQGIRYHTEVVSINQLQKGIKLFEDSKTGQCVFECRVCFDENTWTLQCLEKPSPSQTSKGFLSYLGFFIVS